MNFQQMLYLIGDLAYATADASGQHPAGEIQSGQVNVVVYLSPMQKQAVQELALACQVREEPLDAHRAADHAPDPEAEG